MSSTAKSALWLVGGVVVLGGAVTAGVLLMKPKAATPAPSPTPSPTPGPTPSPNTNLPTTGDVFSSLTTAQQQAVANSLYAYVSQTPSPCPAVATTGITSASQLTDPADAQGLRGIAVNCYQQGYNAANTGSNLGAANGAGVLDVATYNALMNTNYT
jgi:hypothetical protein